MNKRGTNFKKLEEADKQLYYGLIGSVLSFYHRGRKYPNQTVQDVLNDFGRLKPGKLVEYNRIFEKYQPNLLFKLKHKLGLRIKENEGKSCH